MASTLPPSRPPDRTTGAFLSALEKSAAEGRLARDTDPASKVPVFIGEFWTARQRAAHSLHEVSYRACFKPSLPAFFIDALTAPGEVVFDPFAGRGTTALEAVLRERRAVTSDLNPLSRILLAPRLNPPSLGEIEDCLEQLELSWDGAVPEDLLVFFHPETLRELCALRARWQNRGDRLTPAEAWIRMVATNRLTGHSKGFFSVYTMPPNQAVSVRSQRRINERREQQPPRREVLPLILRKSRALLKDWAPLFPPPHAAEARVFTASADDVSALEDASVDLVVTSPPFLDVVDYAGDNWLRMWFNGLETVKPALWVTRRLDTWSGLLERALREMHRVVRPGRAVALEVGEVRKGHLQLEHQIMEAGQRAGLEPVAILLHTQAFTKTAHCWGVENQTRGTNTHRIVLFRRP